MPNICCNEFSQRLPHSVSTEADKSALARAVYPPTENIVLTGHLDPVINDLVVSSRYPNASEVTREGLRLLEPHEAEERARLDALRQATSAGLMDLERGRFIEIGSDTLGEFLADIGERAALSLTRSR